MGQFSWIYSDTHKQLIDNKEADTYLLVPKPFQKKYGKAIYESCYGGYGHFGYYDVYDLIPEWNKNMIPEIESRMEIGIAVQTKTMLQIYKHIMKGKKLLVNFVGLEL
jgi:hypothetical protein